MPDAALKSIDNGDLLRVRGVVVKIFSAKGGSHGLILRSPTFGSLKVFGVMDNPRVGKTLDVMARLSKRGAQPTIYVESETLDEPLALPPPPRRKPRSAPQRGLTVPDLPIQRTDLVRYLADQIHGIGPVKAQQIVQAFDTAQQAIETFYAGKIPALTARGLDAGLATALLEGWSDGAARREASVALMGLGLNRTQIRNALDAGARDPAADPTSRAFFSTLALKICRYPYRLTLIRGIGFACADQAARKLGIPSRSPHRARAAIRHALVSAAAQGHSCLFVSRVVDDSARILAGQTRIDVETPPPAEWLDLVRKNLMALDVETEGLAFPAGTRNDVDPCALAPLCRAEASAAVRLVKLSTAPMRRIEVPAPETFQKILGFPLADAQIDAVRLAINNKVSVITGEPGTGKSQPLDEPVLTPDGWRPIGDIRYGDWVVDPFGTAVQVESTHPQGVLDVYRLTTTRGAYSRCSANHLWLVRLAGSHEQVINTSHIAKYLKDRAVVEIPMWVGPGREPVWMRVASITPDGQTRCVCLKLANEIGLYVTRDHLVTHNTTITKAVMHTFTHAGLRVALMAPTGRAAKRLREATGLEAFTIHQYLNGARTLDGIDVIGADEYSMTDAMIHAALLKRIPPRAFFVMIGDHYQLPSVGPGAILADVIGSGCLPVARLSQIQRVAATNPIHAFARNIRAGRVPPQESVEGALEFASCDDDNRTLQECLRRYTDTLNAGESIDEVVLLSAMRGGVVGVAHLNQRLQALINPVQGPRDLEIGRDLPDVEARVCPGDRVMQTVNDRNLGIVNGDIGTIVRLDKTRHKVTVDFGDGEVEVVGKKLNALRLAYATTVHKSQGAEFRNVIVALSRSQHRMLRRNLLYTGVTRAKKSLSLCGDLDMIRTAVNNSEDMERCTLTRAFLRDGFSKAAHVPHHGQVEEPEPSVEDSSPAFP